MLRMLIAPVLVLCAATACASSILVLRIQEYQVRGDKFYVVLYSGKELVLSEQDVSPAVSQFLEELDPADLERELSEEAVDKSESESNVQLDAGSGRVEVTVTDPTGLILPGTTTVLSGLAGDAVARTDGSGKAVFGSLAPGAYRLRAELHGFQPAEVEVKLSDDEVLSVVLKLGI